MTTSVEKLTTSVEKQDQQWREVEASDDNDPAYDIDCALDIIQANGRPPGTSSMALSQWTQFLSRDAKEIWDKLPDEAKRHSQTRERQDVGLTKILETGT
jgi:hypothetical protein